MRRLYALEKSSLHFPTAGKNLHQIAIPVIAGLALANLPSAEAGPASYATCVSAYLILAIPIAMPTCITGCITY